VFLANGFNNVDEIGERWLKGVYELDTVFSAFPGMEETVEELFISALDEAAKYYQKQVKLKDSCSSDLVQWVNDNSPPFTSSLLSDLVQFGIFSLFGLGNNLSEESIQLLAQTYKPVPRKKFLDAIKSVQLKYRRDFSVDLTEWFRKNQFPFVDLEDTLKKCMIFSLIELKQANEENMKTLSECFKPIPRRKFLNAVTELRNTQSLVLPPVPPIYNPPLVPVKTPIKCLKCSVSTTNDKFCEKCVKEFEDAHKKPFSQLLGRMCETCRELTENYTTCDVCINAAVVADIADSLSKRFVPSFSCLIVLFILCCSRFSWCFLLFPFFFPSSRK
jgi:succinate dehydrogenase flavin-adding protein (antitoxin of CptAB toxin-antitoxin module)